MTLDEFCNGLAIGVMVLGFIGGVAWLLAKIGCWLADRIK